MARYILTRLASSVVTLIIVSFLIFLMMHAIPGGPFGDIQAGLSPVMEENMKRLYGLNLPLMTQYLHYINGLIHLNLGVAWESPGEPMLQLIGTGLGISASVAAFGLLYGIIGGILLGIIAVRHQSKWIDQFINVCSTVVLTTPTYVVAIFLITVFAVSLKWVPAGGWGGVKYMVLPAVAYGVNPLGTVARYTRNAMMEEVNKQYVLVASSKGLSDYAVLIRHVLRSSLGPIINIVAPMIPGLLTGSVFIEAIFNVPGLGGYFVTAILNRDYPLEMTLMIMMAVFMVITYLVADLLNVAADPRIRLGQKNHGG